MSRRRSKRCKRRRKARPLGGAARFRCESCKLLLDDGVIYSHCPACDDAVDWVESIGDKNIPVPPARVANAPARARLWRRLKIAFAIGGYLGYLAVIARSPGRIWRFITLLGPLLVTPIVRAGGHVVRLALNTRELALLTKNREVRVMHGIEHATIAVLLERGFDISEGETGEYGFVIGCSRPAPRLPSARQVRSATSAAAKRIRGGETDLAYALGCGTSWLVSSTLVALALLVLAPLAFWAKVGFATLGLLYGIALVLFLLYADRLGLLAQKHLTVSTKFDRVRVKGVSGVWEKGHRRFFVHLRVRFEGEKRKRRKRRG